MGFKQNIHSSASVNVYPMLKVAGVRVSCYMQAVNCTSFRQKPIISLAKKEINHRFNLILIFTYVKYFHIFTSSWY
jgi:hypothetical protein